jgi:hypothetical protein
VHDINLTVTSSMQNKKHNRMLINKTIEFISKDSSVYQIIEIKADCSDTYVIELKAKYKSDFFKEKLRQMDIDSMSPSQKAKFQNRESYRIDYSTRDVVRNFSKKFKFGAKSPFKLDSKIFVRQNKYFLEAMLENEWSQVFLHSVKLVHKSELLELIDLNPLDKEGELSGSVVKKKEKRSYVYILSPKDSSYEIRKNENFDIGEIEIRWQNIFGDYGSIKFAPIIYMEENDKDLQLYLAEDLKKLTVEVPTWVKVYLLNCTTSRIKLELDLKPEASENIAIHGLSRYTLKKFGPYERAYFNILVFPQFTGIHPLNGLIAKEKKTGKIYSFDENDCEIAFEVEAAKNDHIFS